MDTTEQYIEQCRNAVKIQELWEPAVGDYVALAKFPGQGFLLEIKTEGHEEKPLYQIEHGFNNQYRSELIWLPTQSQLQKIFLDLAATEAPPEVNKIPSSLLLMHSLYEYYQGWPEEIWPFDFKEVSIEQLWLNLVMGLMCEKSWSGKEWEGNKNKESPPDSKSA